MQMNPTAAKRFYIKNWWINISTLFFPPCAVWFLVIAPPKKMHFQRNCSRKVNYDGLSTHLLCLTHSLAPCMLQFFFFPFKWHANYFLMQNVLTLQEALFVLPWSCYKTTLKHLLLSWSFGQQAKKEDKRKYAVVTIFTRSCYKYKKMIIWYLTGSNT